MKNNLTLLVMGYPIASLISPIAAEKHTNVIHIITDDKCYGDMEFTG